MQRDLAIAAVDKYFDQGGFVADLARRVAITTKTQNPDRAPALIERGSVPVLRRAS